VKQKGTKTLGKGKEIIVHKRVVRLDTIKGGNDGTAGSAAGEFKLGHVCFHRGERRGEEENLSFQIQHLNCQEEKLKRGEDIPAGADVELFLRRFSLARFGVKTCEELGDREIFLFLFSLFFSSLFSSSFFLLPLLSS